MALTLRKAVPSDAAAMTEIYLSAFTIDSISLLCFPRNSSATYSWWHDMIVAEMSDVNTHSLVITTSTSDSNPTTGKLDEQVVAWCKWNAPTTAPFDPSLPPWPKGADVSLAKHFFGELFARQHRIMGGKEYWYLECIATVPEWQGKGAAGKLIRWGLQKADEGSLEAYLEASPDGKPIYEHFGFKEEERLVVDLEGKDSVNGEREFVEVMMVRPAKAKGAL